MNSHGKPKPSRALEQWVREQAETQKPGCRLPGDTSLAKSFGVSVATVKRLMARLATEGKVRRVQGKGTFSPAPLPEAGPALPPPASAERFIRIVEEAISSGNFRQGDALPAVKYWCIKYRVSPTTVIGAYRDLASRRLIHKVGKTFWAGAPMGAIKPDQVREVYLFVHGSESGQGECFVEKPYGEAYWEMARELGRHGLVLRVESALHMSELVAAWTGGKRPPRGIILPRIDEGLFALVHPLLARLHASPATRRIPVLLDCWRPYPGRLSRYATVLSRTDVDEMACGAIVDYLVAKGHRHVLYCHPSTDDYQPNIFPWSSIRLERLTRQLEARRTGARITEVRRMPHTSADAWLHRLQARATGRPELENHVGRHGIDRLSKLERSALRLDPLFEACREIADATLWICANDALAECALSWSRMRGLRVPAILGYDHDPRYYHLGLSTYDPDFRRLGYLMAHTILQDIPLQRTPKGVLRFEGMVHEKSTTERTGNAG